MLGTPLRETLDRAGHLASDDDFRRLLAESGVRVGARRRTPADLRELAEVASFMGDVFDGRRRGDAIEEAFSNHRFVARLGELYAISAEGAYLSHPVQGRQRLQETMTTSDFPLLTGTDVIQRELEGGYVEWPLTWPNIARRGTVRDFRDVRVMRTHGLDDRWYPLADYNKPEMNSVRENNNLAEEGYLVGVDVYERGFSLNWRMLINDDLNAFQNLPQRLARGARRTEEYFATSLYATSTGPDGTLYSSGNANIVTGNPALSIAGLQTAMTVLMSQVDDEGEPIMIEAAELMVPPSLAITAQNILNALTIRTTTAGGATSQELEVANWMRGAVHLNINPYLPIIDTTHGTTAWYLFANPNTGRPAIDMRFLRGYETPSLFQKAPDTMRLGGAVDPMLGDFETMEIRYKGMHIFSGVAVDPRATVASEGDGT